MKTAIVIAEYNPFHAGHAAQLAQLRTMGFDTVAVVMSGNFMQRGVPSLLPKQVRAAAALQNGADLIIELPCRFAAAGAEQFASAGVALAAALATSGTFEDTSSTPLSHASKNTADVAPGNDFLPHTPIHEDCKDAYPVLAFGAETPDTALLLRTAQVLCSPQFSVALQQHLQAGLPFFTARSLAAEDLLPGSDALLRTPNNILGVEYCKAILLSNAPLSPMALPRIGTQHNDMLPTAQHASAGTLRSLPMEAWKPYVPANALALYRTAAADGLVLDAARWDLAALARLRERAPQFWADVPDIGEGLDALFYTSCRKASSLDELYTMVKSKRYAHSRIRRIALAAALGWQQQPQAPSYLHILGMTPAGKKLLADLTPPRRKNADCSSAGCTESVSCHGSSDAAAAISEPAPATGISYTKNGLPVSSSLAKLEGVPGCESSVRTEAAAGDFYALCLRTPQPCGLDYRLPLLKAGF